MNDALGDLIGKIGTPPAPAPSQRSRHLRGRQPCTRHRAPSLEASTA